ncbi:MULTISPECIES: hypothetical protein [unclassified Psychrobacter]|uniref:hypothetical protein n=2 Tax=Psychrobacter TaxID=497 RepID=UPI000EC266B5|nr:MULTISPECIES: hypothetical protein [unclassified Psychrobacter]MBE8608471.1 hypothetical protein [Pseudomonas lundensis]HCI75358.1 hypothetical protein [Psychrobacter sp.]
MHKMPYVLNSIISQLFSEHIYRVLALIAAMGLMLVSNTSSARVDNPGAVCPAGFSKDKLTDSDYTNLFLSSSNNNYFNVAGNASDSIPLQMKMDLSESSTSNTNNNFSIIDASQYRVINIGRNFSTPTAYTDITLSFRNKTTQQPLYLTNVAVSAFDIDYSNSGNNLFDDYVRITGTTESGSIIDGTLQTISGSNVIYSAGLNNSTSFNCPSRDLDTRCQGSIQFSQAVSEVTFRYTNNPIYVKNDPTNQEVQIRVDNYCYVPQYIFSGTVFDDNGGITDTQADANNANITSGTYFNKPNYFNGVFNTPQELGISGSNVRLANCSNTSTTYPTQSVIRNGASVGEYQISIPKTTLANNTNLCLVESRTGATYPIRTSSESRNVGFSATTYNYPNNNFGRVIAANAALVLQKYQFVNDCNASTLVYASVPITGDPRTGFSMDPIQDNITPQQCIAYKITATNRANLAINNFVMSDVLQKKDVKGAQATSIRVAPTDPNGSFANGSVDIGLNGTVQTTELTLPKITKRDFYFNTKYGTTVNP